MDMGGWEADGNAKTLLKNIGIEEQYFYTLMKDMDPKQKVKVLVSMFGRETPVELEYGQAEVM